MLNNNQNQLKSNKLHVLVTAELIFDELHIFDNIIEFEFAGYGVNHIMLSPDEFREKCKNADVVITEFDVIDEALLSVAKKLKLIICCRGGVATVVDLDAAKKHGVVVCNNPGRNKIATAEFTIALILDIWRNISVTNHLIHIRELQKTASIMPIGYGDSLWGLESHSPYVAYRGDSFDKLTLGIIGYGNVGKVVAHLAKKLGMHVIIADYASLNKETLVGVEILGLNELLQKADVVTIHASNNNRGSPIIGKRELALMKSSAYLINTARGFMVDEDALISALNNKLIQGAALDVTREEPLSVNSKLLSFSNIILTPHIAGSTKDTLRVGTQMVIETLKDYFCGIVPLHIVK